MSAGQLALEPIASQLPVKQATAMELLHVALQNHAAIDVIERLAALQERMRATDAEVQFNLAMNAAQSEVGRIAPNATNTETNSRWATYSKLDAAIRPIYIKNGFSLSFDTADAPSPEMVRAVCYVSHREGHTRRYQADVPYADKGPKGGSVMTKTHGSGAAMSYAQRYLLKYIFNIAIGEDDIDGNSPKEPAMEGIEDWCTAIRDAHNFDEMDQSFRTAYSKASAQKNKTAKAALEDARNDWRKRKGGK